MSLKHPESYNETVAAALTQELKKSNGKAEALTEILLIHVRTLGRLIAMVSRGEPEKAATLTATAQLLLNNHVAESLQSAEALMQSLRSRK